MTAARPRVVTRAFALVVGVTFVVFAAFGVVILALPLYVRDSLAGSDLAVGMAVGAGSIGAILAGAPAGRVSDRRGRRAVLVAALAAMLSGYLVLALEPSLPVVASIRVLAGVGEAAFVVAAFTMAADLAPSDRRGEAMSLVTVGAYGGLAVGPVVADLVLGDGRFALVWLVAAAGIVLTALVALALPETRPEAEEAAPRGWLPPQPALLPGLVLLFVLLGFGGFNAFGALHAREVGLEHPGLVFLVFGGVVVAVRVFGRRLPDRLGARRAASMAAVAVAAGSVVLAVWSSEAGLFIGAAVFAAGQALAYPAVVLLAMARVGPAARSAAVGAVAAFVDVALAGGAFVLAFAADAFDYEAVFLAGAGSALIGLVLLRTTTARPAPVLEPAP